MQTIATWLAKLAMKIAALILAAMTAAVVYEVVMRNFFNAPTVWSVEYTSYAMAWLGLLGASETLRRNDHVGIRVLTDRLPEGARFAVSLFANLAVAVTAGWLAFASALWTIAAYRLDEVSDTVLQTPQVLVRIAFPIGMLLIVLVSLARIVDNRSDRKEQST